MDAGQEDEAGRAARSRASSEARVLCLRYVQTGCAEPEGSPAGHTRPCSPPGAEPRGASRYRAGTLQFMWVTLASSRDPVTVIPESDIRLGAMHTLKEHCPTGEVLPTG